MVLWFWLLVFHIITRPNQPINHLTVTQAGAQTGLKYLHRRRLHNLSGQSVLVLQHSDSDEVLPCIRMKLSVFQFLPIAPYSVAMRCWKEPVLIHLTPVCYIFISSDGGYQKFSCLEKAHTLKHWKWLYMHWVKEQLLPAHPFRAS